MPRSATPETVPPPPLQPVRSVVSPLWPVLSMLVVTMIVLSVLLAWLFPRPVVDQEPRLRFTDVTAESGLGFVHHQGGDVTPTTLGGAVAVLDFNDDGAPDLFFVNGAPWPWEETLEKRPSRNSALYRNDGHGHFTDVTAAAGLNGQMQSMGIAVGDYDNDGRPDLFVTCIGRNHLFHNLGHGHFEDVTEEAQLSGDDTTWSSGAVWLDLDGDGKLDLIVLHYARWPEEVGLQQAFTIADVGRSYGSPAGFTSVAPSVYRNLGDGRFARLADSAGLRDIDPDTGAPMAFPLSIVPLDANNDGRLDLLITYQNSAPSLFLGQPNGTFIKQGANSSARHEGATASLVSASGLSSLADGVADRRASILLRLANGPNHGGEDQPLDLASKLAVAVADFNLDGRLEVFSSEGAAEFHVNRFESGRDFNRRPAILYSNQDYRPLSDPSSPDAWAVSRKIRGVAYADFDGDGDLDVVLAQNEGPPVLLRNDLRAGRAWLRLKLVASHGVADAYGARVEVHTPRRVMTQTVMPVVGFMAQSEPILTFGFGDDARIRKIMIHWPSGKTQELQPETLNQLITVREP